MDDSQKRRGSGGIHHCHEVEAAVVERRVPAADEGREHGLRAKKQL